MLFEASPDTQAPIDTIVTLPEETDTLAIARACRDVGLVFVNESESWKEAELAMWLLGPYARVTEYVRSERACGAEARAVPLLGEIDAATIEHLLRTTRLEVRSVLESLLDPEEAATFSFSMLAAGAVLRCEDSLAGSGWAPTRVPRRLADRVLSLFAADYLTRPADYELELAVCKLCRTVEFDSATRARGACERHRAHGHHSRACHRLSTVAPARARVDRRATIPYVCEAESTIADSLRCDGVDFGT